MGIHPSSPLADQVRDGPGRRGHDPVRDVGLQRKLLLEVNFNVELVSLASIQYLMYTQYELYGTLGKTS